jgi:hypothetical protein
MVKESERLIELVATIINRRQDAEKISPSWIAGEAMRELHAIDLQATMPLVYLGCHMHLRQIARSLCARTFEDDQGLAQHDLFPALQRRYPIARPIASEEPQYIKLEAMTEADVKYNVDRLRSEANAKQKHADALEAWWRKQRVA